MANRHGAIDDNRQSTVFHRTGIKEWSGTHVWIDFFGQNADLFGRQLGEQLVDIELFVLAQVLAVKLGRRGRHGSGFL